MSDLATRCSRLLFSFIKKENCLMNGWLSSSDLPYLSKTYAYMEDILAVVLPYEHGESSHGFPLAIDRPSRRSATKLSLKVTADINIMIKQPWNKTEIRPKQEDFLSWYLPDLWYRKYEMRGHSCRVWTLLCQPQIQSYIPVWWNLGLPRKILILVCNRVQNGIYKENSNPFYWLEDYMGLVRTIKLS